MNRTNTINVRRPAPRKQGAGQLFKKIKKGKIYWRMFQSAKNSDEILHRLTQVIHDLAMSVGSSARDAMMSRSAGLVRNEMIMPVVMVQGSFGLIAEHTRTIRSIEQKATWGDLDELLVQAILNNTNLLYAACVENGFRPHTTMIQRRCSDTTMTVAGGRFSSM